MPINLHLTPTVPSKHPSIAGAFLIFGTGVSRSLVYLVTLVPQLLHGPAEADIQVVQTQK